FEALQELRAAGLNVVFSSTLVEPALLVTLVPGVGSPEAIARRILAPHGLQLVATAPGMFAVTRAAPAGSTEAPAPSGQIAEIKVFASRYEIGRQAVGAPLELSRRQLQGLPGLDQDAMRVTRYVPGTASHALSARTHVRGGRDDELAVWFDDAPLFEPFHFKDVQGIVGLLDPGAVQSVEFYSGVFPVRYGNRLSGVLDFKPRSGSNDHHEIGASLLYLHGLTQGQLDSYPVEWLAAVRHSTVDAIADSLGRTDLEPNFLDALGRFEWKPTDQTDVAAGWLLLDDGLGANIGGGAETGDLNYRDGTVWLKWRQRWGPQFDTLAVLSYTNRRTDRTGSIDRPGSVTGVVADRRRFRERTPGAWRGPGAAIVACV
ncbi:MAG: TonB-dependent receptor, partial [Gammaproteobacteria bacterium]|nr:TonB-dependent receptor [Gammaproteobacteria bacterium]